MDLRYLAHSVLFPVLTEVKPTDNILRFLDSGGQALLFGEYGEEYVSGRLNPERGRVESKDLWSKTLASLRQRSGRLLAAADADISAVNRFSHLAPALPTLQEAKEMDDDEFEKAIFRFAQALPGLGINMVLSPTADVVSGHNPWLQGRTLGDDISYVSDRVSGYVSAMKRAGMQSALKHFPGHPTLNQQPSSEDAAVQGTLDDLRPYLEPFSRGISSGADAVLLSPVSYPQIDSDAPTPLSAKIIDILKTEMAFSGLVITCDLDHKATQGRRSLGQTAVSALAAGADLLLISPTAAERIPEIAEAIQRAVNEGDLRLERLSDASNAIRRLATE